MFLVILIYLKKGIYHIIELKNFYKIECIAWGPWFLSKTVTRKIKDNFNCGNSLIFELWYTAPHYYG